MPTHASQTAPSPTAAAVALTVRAAPPRPCGWPKAHGGSDAMGHRRRPGALGPQRVTVNHQIIKKYRSERNPQKPRLDWSCVCQFHSGSQNINCSQCRYAPFGRRLSLKTKKHTKFEKKPICRKISHLKLCKKTSTSYPIHNITDLT